MSRRTAGRPQLLPGAPAESFDAYLVDAKAHEPRSGQPPQDFEDAVRTRAWLYCHRHNLRPLPEHARRIADAWLVSPGPSRRGGGLACSPA